MEKLQNIELTIKDEQEQGVFAISFVDRPAIEEPFILLSEMEVEMKVIDENKREVIGLALVPDKKILRRHTDKETKKTTEFTVSFSAETIAKTQELYMKKLYGNNVTVDHAENVDGVALIESWIVEDSKNDKSNIYKLNAPVGSWVVKMKVYNEEVYQGIKDGKFNGFSIEGKYDGLEQLEMQDDIMNEIKELLEKL
jgi:hypothetical protein